ncbi:hypothetical protein EYZ11_002546 [Aspergillus tanneri]|uniref:Uncharacterized protein n=1 Tax=Aspergillus tanneri TaxID=1220188 RepID=A0A4S3JQM2_9EURO|nr:hypothetical protein EYZ11_002546 [Aspergillus tanneri]
MTDDSTIEEVIIKRDGNLYYKDSGNGKTTVVWRYWPKLNDKFLSKVVVARLLKLFIWKSKLNT